MTYDPIWKDYPFDLTSLDASFIGAPFLFYRVVIDAVSSVSFSDGTEQVVASGKAYQKPGANDISIIVNDILADHFAKDTLDLINIWGSDNAFKDDVPVDALTALAVRVDASLDGVTWVNGTDKRFFIRDWSYDDTITWTGKIGGLGLCLNDPIREEIPLGAFFPVTVVDFGNSAGVTNLGMGITNNIGEAVLLNDYPTYYGTGTGALKITGVSPQPGDVIHYYGWDVNDEVAWEGKGIKVIPQCHRFVLYYLNAFGGWDWLEVQGEPTHTEGYARSTAGKRVSNEQSWQRQRFDYRNDITEKWRLPLGYFADDQAAKLHHLVGTVDAYLYDIPGDRFIPVLVKDTECVEKTYKNQGRKRVEYAVNVELARFEQRR